MKIIGMDSLNKDYQQWATLPDLFPVHFAGVKTGRDEALVSMERGTLAQTIDEYMNYRMSDAEIAEKYPALLISTKTMDAIALRHKVLRSNSQGVIVRYAYRPFDNRWVYWSDTKLLEASRPDYFPNVREDNLWLITQPKARRDWTPPQLTTLLADLQMDAGKASCFPLYVYDIVKKNKQKGLFDPMPTATRKLNLSPLAQSYLKRVRADETALFYHALAVMHSPAYRTENLEALRQDWARLPLPEKRDGLLKSAALGRQVAALLDVETPLDALHPQTIAVLQTSGASPDFTLAGGNVVENGASVDVYLNATTYWQNIPVAVWEYTLGGYQVLKKWLSYRDARVLQRAMKPEEVREFSEIARRIGALVALAGDLDANYQGMVTYP